MDDFTAGKESPLIEQFKIDILAACGQTEKAARLLMKTLSHDPANITVRLQHTIFLERLGRADEAVTELEKLSREFPDKAVIKNNLGYLMIEQGIDPQRAGRLLQEACRADPQAGATLDSLGWFYYKEGQFDRAREYICQAAALMMKTDFEVWDHLGDVHYRLGRSDQAGQYWRGALKDLRRRLVGEKHLAEDKSRIEKKLEQLAAGETVAVAPLFDHTNQ